MLFEELIGKRPIAIYLSDDKEHLRIITNSTNTGCYLNPALTQEFGWVCDGDCCSTSWIEHINGIKFLLGHTVLKVATREMPASADNIVGHDVVQFYGWTLETDAGRCDIEMRNDSNGYYGGSLERDYGQDQYGSLKDTVGNKYFRIKENF